MVTKPLPALPSYHPAGGGTVDLLVKKINDMKKEIYYIDGYPQEYSTLAAIRHHIRLMPQFDALLYDGLYVVRKRDFKIWELSVSFSCRGTLVVKCHTLPDT